MVRRRRNLLLAEISRRLHYMASTTSYLHICGPQDKSLAQYAPCICAAFYLDRGNLFHVERSRLDASDFSVCPAIA